MMNGQMPIDFDKGQVFNLDITKIEEAISRGRGFYEFIAIDENDHKEKIFRFSSVAFRNNYTMSDIAKMQLSLYAVHGILARSTAIFFFSAKDTRHKLRQQ